MQRKFNNTSSSITDKISNEIYYDFISCINTDLIDFFSLESSSKILINESIQDNITFLQTLFKHYYDKSHSNYQMQINDWTLLKLHKKYDILSAVVLEKKLSQ